MEDIYGYESDHEHQIHDEHTFAENVREAKNRPYFIRWKSGKRVDPRLLTTLKSFGEVYMERKETFKNIFPGMYDDFVAVFKKLGAALLKNEEMRSKTLKRSLSFGNMRAVGHGEEGSEPVLEYFRVKYPKVVIMGGSSDNGQGGNQDDKDDKGPNNSK